MIWYHYIIIWCIYIIFMISLGLIWASSLGHWCLTGSDSLPVHGGGTAGAPCHPCHSSPQAKADQHPNLWRIYGGFMEDLSGLILVILPNNGWWCYVAMSLSHPSHNGNPYSMDIYIYTYIHIYIYICMVGDFNLPLWKMMEFVSWDDDILNWMEK